MSRSVQVTEHCGRLLIGRPSESDAAVVPVALPAVICGTDDLQPGDDRGDVAAERAR